MTNLIVIPPSNNCRGEREQGSKGARLTAPPSDWVWGDTEEREISLSPFPPFPLSPLRPQGDRLPARHAGRVPHKGIHEGQWRFVGQPSRMPGGGDVTNSIGVPTANRGRGARERGSRRDHLPAPSAVLVRGGIEEREFSVSPFPHFPLSPLHSQGGAP